MHVIGPRADRVFMFFAWVVVGVAFATLAVRRRVRHVGRPGRRGAVVTVSSALSRNASAGTLRGSAVLAGAHGRGTAVGWPSGLAASVRDGLTTRSPSGARRTTPIYQPRATNGTFAGRYWTIPNTRSVYVCACGFRAPVEPSWAFTRVPHECALVAA